jgi:uncharacterized RDD family membrane protein YckC
MDTPATNDRRFAAWCIDGVVLAAIFLLLGIPLKVWTDRGSLIATAYVLLRDVGGASPGKLALGLRVVNQEGAPASLAARVLRNATLAIASALNSVLNYGLARLIPDTAIMVESCFLVSKGQRIGDRIAHTKVVRRRPG